MYIGKSVVVQHRVATGKAGLKASGKGIREHVGVPTELQTHHAMVLSETPEEGQQPKLTVIYKKDELALNTVELQSGFLPLYDVPHKDSPTAEGGLFWSDELGTQKKAISDMTAGISILREQLKGKDAEIDKLKGLPSASDLDKVADEKKVQEITTGKKSKKE